MDTNKVGSLFKYSWSNIVLYSATTGWQTKQGNLLEITLIALSSYDKWTSNYIALMSIFY